MGLAVAEILRGLADTLRAEEARISYRLILISGWALLLLWQLWWAVWRVVDRPEWTFPEYLIFLFPVAILYMIARLCFLALVASRFHNATFQLFVIIAMVAQVIWRGLSTVVGN